MSHAGAVLLLRTAEKTGLAAALTTELALYRKPLAPHDPGKIVLDLATALAIGGDCLADITQLRAHPEIFRAVAFDPTVSRLISVLATDADTALAAIARARTTARTHDLIEYLTKGRLSYSVGFGLTDAHAEAIDLVPEYAWTPAYDADGQVRDGAWVTEITDLLDLSSWPKGMRIIVRRERPHPGAQLRFTDRDGLRLTAFVTNTRRGQLPDLELRHRRRARWEDRIRTAKTTGLQNLPLHGFDQNRLAALPAPA